ncbi:prephenate dehydrogenase [Desulfothermus okinawensis JCM 13304]
MGTFFEKRLKSQGEFTVYGIDRPFNYSYMDSIFKDLDMVLLCIPAYAIKDVVLGLSSKLNKNTILVDICSVKVLPMEAMLKSHCGPVVGTHPLFGPDPGPDIPLKIAIVRGRGDYEVELVKQIFKSIGCNVFECSAKEHDQAMAFIQGLNFVTTLSYFAAFSDDESLLKFITPSFKRRIESAKKMLTEDSSLFQTLFESNPYSHEAVKKFRSFLNLASAGDLDLLVQKAWWWWKVYPDRGDVP